MVLALLVCAWLPQGSSMASDPLEASFRNPPSSARPHTWWHWMDGNVTREGITADLEAMREVGIGGAQMFTVAQGIPKGPVDYMSPAWREMTLHAVREAGRLGIELCLHNCAGWSSSGGPWVRPEHAMQVVAWSETLVSGPQPIRIALPPVQAPQVYAKVPYSRDIAVFAVRRPSVPAQRSGSFLGKTGVVRQDGLTVDLDGSARSGIPRGEWLDVTRHMDEDGLFDWNAPAGDWLILRIGHVPTGKNNHPAPPEGDGLEVDKMSREAMDAFWSGTMAAVLRDAGPLAGKVLNNALIDSYEVGGQNWTPRFREEFRRLRGYDCRPYLPVLAGYLVDDRETSERFLWDYRRTLADLFAENYFGYFAELCRRHGVQFSTEPYGNGNFDNLQVGGLADVPMGEFWLGGGTLETTKIASSAGHVYGRTVIGAEAFTAGERQGAWLEEPYAAKALGDLVFCNGVNRYIFHRYAHQPWMDQVPGMTMGPWGTHLERTQTWWTEAKEWMRYIARCQFMLQSGKFVGDVLYFTGESAPADLPYRPYLNPKMPAGYDYDGIDASALLRCTVSNGRIVSPGGTSYRLLVLPNTDWMTPRTARKIEALVRSGAAILGPAPRRSPSLTNRVAADAEVAAIGSRVWSGADAKGARYGTGWVFTGAEVGAALARIGAAVPDLSYVSRSGGSQLVWIHRRLPGAEVYFVSNQAFRATRAECAFRMEGLSPELWHPDTGEIEPAPIWRREPGRTIVDLRFEPAESVFVVFRNRPGRRISGLEVVADTGPPPRTPVLKILRARYETADGRGADVTARVAELAAQGETEIAATNGNFGDPVVNVVKQLVVEYTVDGKPMKKTVPENETLILIPLARAASRPTHRLLSRGDGMTLIPLEKARFDVRMPDGRTLRIEARSPDLLDLSRGWTVDFRGVRGAPAGPQPWPTLTSWSEHPLPAIRYFSGSAVYRKEFRLPAAWAVRGRVLELDLGRVKNFATVTLNGHTLPALWKEPFRLDVSRWARAGSNRLEIRATNLWVNRIIGDEQLPPDVEWNGNQLKEWPKWLPWPRKPGEGARTGVRSPTGRTTFSTWRYWLKDSPLLESGLLGPVRLVSAVALPLR